MTDWEQIKEKYLSTDITYAKLADEEGINQSTLRHRGKKEDWDGLRKKLREPDREERMERVTVKLLERMERAIDRNEEMDSKEIKAMTGALKELKELKLGDEGEGGGKKLEVCFIGEAEELSR